MARHLLLKDVITAERYAMRQVDGLSKKLVSFASSAIRNPKKLNQIDLKFIDLYRQPLAEALLIADLTARLRIRRMAKKAPLSLSALKKVLNLYRVIDRGKVDRLELFYQSRAVGLLDDTSSTIESSVRQAIAESIELGEPTAAATTRLMRTFKALGVGGPGKHRIETLVRTNTQMIYSAARWSEEQDPDIQEILWGYEYSHVGDTRVRPEHEILGGTILEKEHSFWDNFMPPNGWNCRCVAIPLFQEEKRVFPKDRPTTDPEFNFNPGSILAGII